MPHWRNTVKIKIEPPIPSIWTISLKRSLLFQSEYFVNVYPHMLAFVFSILYFFVCIFTQSSSKEVDTCLHVSEGTPLDKKQLGCASAYGRALFTEKINFDKKKMEIHLITSLNESCFGQFWQIGPGTVCPVLVSFPNLFFCNFFMWGMEPVLPRVCYEFPWVALIV